MTAPLSNAAYARDEEPFVPAGMSEPDIGPDEIQAVNDVLSSGRLSIGPHLSDFEQRLASYAGTAYAAGVNSGTSGLHLAVIAAGIGEGDLAVASPFSFVASANCLLYERALPVFVDVDEQTGNLDPSLVSEAVSDIESGSAASRALLPPSARESSAGTFAERLKAILPVHIFGIPVDMDPIAETASRHDLAILEDACEALGAEYKGRPVGSLGHAGVFGFYPNKQLTTGEGGAIVTNLADWDGLFRSLRNQGRDVFNAWLGHDRLGYNYRLDELSAALGHAQLGRMEELLAARARVASWYEERLRGLPGIVSPSVPSYVTRRSWFVFAVRLSAPFDRSRLIEKLAAEDVPARPYFPPIHLQPLYRERFGYQPGSFPVAEKLGETTLALPFSGVMSEPQVDYVCDRIRKIAKTL